MNDERYTPLAGPAPSQFETQRLRLRAFQSSDVELIYSLYTSDPVATRYMSFPTSRSPEDTRPFVDGVVKYFAGEDSHVRHFAWLITLKGSNEYIGSLGFGPASKFSLVGGYVLNQKFWGHGYASEAWKCLLDWAKAQPGVYRVEAIHDVDNPASGRVLEKSGMQREGVLRRYGVHPNVSPLPRDAVMYAWVRE